MSPEAVLSPKVNIECSLVDQEYSPLGDLLPYRIKATGDKSTSSVIVYEAKIDQNDEGWERNVYFRAEPWEKGLLIKPSSLGTNGEKLSRKRGVADRIMKVLEDHYDTFWLTMKPIYLSDNFWLGLNFSKPSKGEAEKSFVHLYEFSGSKVTPVEGERKRNISWRDKEFVLFPFYGSQGWGVLVASQSEWREKVDSLKGLFKKD